MKPPIIGEAPSKNELVPRPISGRSGRRLARCAVLTLEEFLGHFERANLLSVRQDTAEKGFTFDLDAARQAAERMRTRFEKDQIVILLGQRVARAFDADRVLFVEQQVNGARVFVVPHPSGVNRWWNDPAHIVKMELFMHDIVELTRAKA